MNNQPDQDEPVLETNAYAPPLVAPEAHRAPEGITKAQRLAGVCLIVGGVLNFAERYIESRERMASPEQAALGANAMGILLSIVFFLLIVFFLIDLILGSLLIARKNRFVSAAVIRVVLGLIITALAQLNYLRNDQLDLPWSLLIFIPNIALLILLTGKSVQSLRIGLGSAGFGLSCLVTLWGIGVTTTGVNPLGWAFQTSDGTIESSPIEEITGREVAYKLKLPPNKWYLARNNKLGDGTDADRWLIRPDINAQIVITLDQSPEMGTLPDDYTTSNLKHFQENKKVYGATRKPFRPYPDKGHLVTFDTERSFEPDGWLVGIVTTYHCGYFIQAFAPKKVFADIEPELRTILESLELPPEAPVKPPADCHSDAVGNVDGSARPFVLYAPQGRWFLRKADAARKDNPSVDTWIVRPEKDAHIWVIVNSVAEGEIDLDEYTDAVAKTITAETNMTLLGRDRPPSRSKEGRILKAKGHSEGMEFKYLYGVYVDGSDAYQVVGVTRATHYDAMEADFMQAIEKFEFPKKK